VDKFVPWRDKEGSKGAVVGEHAKESLKCTFEVSNVDQNRGEGVTSWGGGNVNIYKEKQ